MFTGLIEDVGHVETIEPAGTGRTIRIATALGAELRAGDSIAVSGACLTATSVDARGFVATLSPETLRVTTFGEVVAGSAVNLERPLRADARLGGHFVLGHVDAVGQIAAFIPDGVCYVLDVDCAPGLAPYLIAKGSIAIDGISLTIAELAGTTVRIQVVPYTASHTTLGHTRTGDRVNVETDVLGKYVASLIGVPGAVDARTLAKGDA